MKTITRLSAFLFLALGTLWASTDSNSLVQDGAMNDPAPWERYLNAKNSGQVELDTEVFVSAPSSLRIANSSTGQYTGVRQIVEVIPGKQYLFRCKIRTEDIVAGEKKGFGPRVLIQSGDSDNLVLSKDMGEGSREWTEFEQPFVPASEQIRIFLYLHHRSGTVWFDDVELLQD